MGTQETIAEAVKLHAQGDIENAIGLYKKALSDSYKHPAFYYANFAAALRSKGKLEFAKEIADKLREKKLKL